MDRISGGWVGGDAMHGLVADRVGNQPKRFRWREMRDLSCVVTMSTLAPVAALAFRVGASRVATLALTAVAAVAAGWMVRVLRLEYGLEINAEPFGSAFARSKPVSASSRWRTVALRLIPARHRPATGTTSVGVSTPGQRTRAARPRR